MIRFSSDYGEGAHPEILQALADTNWESSPGYGTDHYSLEAAELIRRQCAAPNAFVQLLAGGTQTNLLVLCAALRPHQGVIAPASGHISAHETGAIEATGHKVIELACTQGKLTAGQVRAAAQAHRNDANHEHTVQPKAVYISQPTEYGTLYSREEMGAISAVCREWGLLLYVDGARMGYALAAKSNDVDLPFLAETCDAFYIGGTKVGALFGEALVITNPAIAHDFRYLVKQRGALLAKGRILGVQFKTLFQDGLYMRGAAHAMAMAEKLAEGLAALGVPLLMPYTTNQLFPVLPKPVIEGLAQKYEFEPWEAVDENSSAIRLCTAWSTPAENVDAILADLGALLGT